MSADEFDTQGGQDPDGGMYSSLEGDSLDSGTLMDTLPATPKGGLERQPAHRSSGASGRQELLAETQEAAEPAPAAKRSITAKRKGFLARIGANEGPYVQRLEKVSDYLRANHPVVLEVLGWTGLALGINGLIVLVSSLMGWI